MNVELLDGLARMEGAVYPPGGDFQGPLPSPERGGPDPEEFSRRLAYADLLEEAARYDEAAWQRVIADWLRGRDVTLPASTDEEAVDAHYFAWMCGMGLELRGLPARPVQDGNTTMKMILRHGVPTFLTVRKTNGRWWAWGLRPLASGLKDWGLLKDRLGDHLLRTYEKRVQDGRRLADQKLESARREALCQKASPSGSAYFCSPHGGIPAEIYVYRDAWIADITTVKVLPEAVTDEFAQDARAIRDQVVALIEGFRAKYSHRDAQGNLKEPTC